MSRKTMEDFKVERKVEPVAPSPVVKREKGQPQGEKKKPEEATDAYEETQKNSNQKKPKNDGRGGKLDILA